MHALAKYQQKCFRNNDTTKLWKKVVWLLTLTVSIVYGNMASAV